jgi:hypothetical protein
VGAQVGVGEAVWVEPEDQQDGEECLGAGVAEAQSGGVLSAGVGGCGDGGKRGGAGGGVVG